MLTVSAATHNPHCQEEPGRLHHWTTMNDVSAGPGVTSGWPGARAWLASTWTASEPRALRTFVLNEYSLN